MGMAEIAAGHHHMRMHLNMGTIQACALVHRHDPMCSTGIVPRHRLPISIPAEPGRNTAG